MKEINEQYHPQLSSSAVSLSVTVYPNTSHIRFHSITRFDALVVGASAVETWHLAEAVHCIAKSISALHSVVPLCLHCESERVWADRH